jgi:photosystem II stability/assembly factor-like uncharacterized protein
LDQVGHPEVGFAGLESGGLWRTLDSGKSWNQMKVETFVGSISDIIFKNFQIGWLVSKDGGSPTVYRTYDGGQTWSIIKTGETYTALYYNSNIQRLFLSTWDKVLFFSVDDGTSWQKSGSFDALNGYAFSDQNTGICSISTSGNILQTHDGGLNWTLTSETVGTWQPTVGNGSSTFYMFSEYTNSLRRSDDVGSTWNTISKLSVPKDGNTGYEFTGCLRIDECNQLFTQSSTVGLFFSYDEGISWQSIGGPSNIEDTRFCISGHDIFASDINGSLLAYCIDSLPSTLSIAKGNSTLFSKDCEKVDTEIYFRSSNCGNRVDTIISASILSSHNFLLSSNLVTPRIFYQADSLQVIYQPDRSGSDTCLLSLRFIINGREVDTIVHFFGTSTPQLTPFTPKLNISQSGKQASLQPGKDITIFFSLSSDIAAAEGLDSLMFDLRFNPDMLNLDSANAPSGWIIRILQMQSGWYNCRFYNSSHSDIVADQALAFFHFSSYLTKDTVSIISLKAGNVFFDPVKHVGCTVAAMPEDDSVIIHAADTCSDPSLRQFLLGQPLLSIISMRPNPAANEIRLELNSASPCNADLIIIDELGRICKKLSVNLEGNLVIPISLETLPSGEYHILIRSGLSSVSAPFIKMN